MNTAMMRTEMPRLSICPVRRMVPRVDDATPYAPVVHRAHDGVRVRRGEQGESEAEAEEAKADDGQRDVPAPRKARTETARRSRWPCPSTRRRAVRSVRHPPRERREDGHDDGLGDEDEPGGLGREPLDVLEVEAQEEGRRPTSRCS